MRETPQEGFTTYTLRFGNNAHLEESVIVLLSLYIRNGTT